MDYYRIVLISVMLLSQGCLFAPFAIWSMNAAIGFDIVQASIILAGVFTTLVANLAVQPMRYTLPIYFVATLAQVTIMVINILTIL